MLSTHGHDPVGFESIWEEPPMDVTGFYFRIEMDSSKKKNKDANVVCDGGRFDRLVDSLGQGGLAKRSLFCLAVRVYAGRLLRFGGAPRQTDEMLVHVGPQPVDDPVHGGFPDEERIELCARLNECGICAEWVGPEVLSTEAVLFQSRLGGCRAFICKASGDKSKADEALYRVRLLESTDSSHVIQKTVNWSGMLQLLGVKDNSGTRSSSLGAEVV